MVYIILFNSLHDFLLVSMAVRVGWSGCNFRCVLEKVKITLQNMLFSRKRHTFALRS